MKNIFLLTIIATLLNSCVVEIQIDGCTDPSAINYNADADNNDGTCLYYIYGCTDPAAYNFNPQANTNNGSCLYYIYGCTDPLALNFNPLATTNDGSCLYGIYGCTDPAANNFDPQANLEQINACQYSANLVYYLDYSASQYMLNWGISYYSFYDSYNNYIGNITNDFYWTSPPNCLPQGDGSTLTATLYWNGNYNNNLGTFSWQAYPDNEPIADYDYTEINVIPGECRKLQLSKKKITEYKASK